MDNLEQALKQQIVEALNLDDVNPDEIETDAPLFGEGLGLDSIDALELVVMVERCYGIKIRTMEVGQQALASVSALAAFIEENRDAP